MQLFLLHFAGGNVYSFEFLKKGINGITFIPLELPGRGKRHREELIKDKNKAIEDYYNQIKSLRNGEPYMIYGHSMGATLGVSVAEKLENEGDSPEVLIVSGNAGPGVKKKNDYPLHVLNDAEFKQELIDLGGIPVELIQNQELFDYFLPIIRADFECIEKGQFSEKGIKLNTSIVALMGNSEETCGAIENWGTFTKSDFKCKVMEGDHFFIYKHAQEVSNIFIKHSELTSIY